MRYNKDWPDLQKHFAWCTGEKTTGADSQEAAKALGCEVEVIKAFAHVESHGAGFDELHRPVILYERHEISRHTGHKFDSKNADISSTKAYTTAALDKHKQAIADNDRHGTQGDYQYERFEKAYMLDVKGAIETCLWAEFQILGKII